MRIERAGEIAIVRIEGGKANAMSRAMLDALDGLLVEVERSDARAVVLTGYDRYFSAGLALPELVDLDRAQMRAFIDRFGEVMLRIFALPLPTVAAVNGHAIAGGCVLALQCDVRFVAEGEVRIGLNEAQLGIGLPAAVLEPLRLQIPAASWIPMALEGRLFLPGEAIDLGLVEDMIAPGELLPFSVERARALARVPRAAYGQIKSGLRRPAIEAMRAGEAARESWLDTWFDPEAQTRLRATVERLRGGAERPLRT